MLASTQALAPAARVTAPAPRATPVARPAAAPSTVPADRTESRPALKTTRAPATDVTGMGAALAARPARPQVGDDYRQFKTYTTRVQRSLEAADRWAYLSPQSARWELRDASWDLRSAMTSRAPAAARMALWDVERRIDRARMYIDRAIRNPRDTFARMQAQSEIWWAQRDVERALREVERAENRTRRPARTRRS